MFKLNALPEVQGCTGCGEDAAQVVTSGGGEAWDGSPICDACLWYAQLPEQLLAITARRQAAVRRSRLHKQAS